MVWKYQDEIRIIRKVRIFVLIYIAIWIVVGIVGAVQEEYFKKPFWLT